MLTSFSIQSCDKGEKQISWKVLEKKIAPLEGTAEEVLLQRFKI